MDISITEGVYSRDTCEPSLCLFPNGKTCWVAWAAYGRKGSRAFARRIDGGTAGEIVPVSPHERMQTRPICLPAEEGVRFVWFEKEGQTYSVWSRRHDGDTFTACEELHRLPESAKPWELQAVCDESGALWVCWAQAVKGRSSIEGLRKAPEGAPMRFSIENGRCSYRPRMAAWRGEDIYLVWDSYVDGVYDVYGCPAGMTGPGDVAKISRDTAWENRSAICRDREGALWAVWVRGQDVMYRGSTIQQKFSLRGARYDGCSWEPVLGADGGEEIAPLHYGLLTDFPHPPQLGHMGRRLFPMVKGAEEGGVWLFYEAKADQEANTLVSRGHLFAHRWTDGVWSGPYSAAEGRMFYELPHNSTVGCQVFLLAQDVETDERHLEVAALSADLPAVPEENRRVDLTEWKEIRLPFGERRERSRNELPGDEAGALTGIWAERLDRASLLAAIKARRCYATAGGKILMEFTVNDRMMGSALTVREDPVLKWRVVGEADREYVLRIHRDGRLMHDGRFVGSTAGELEEFMLCRYRPGRHYYHLEVLSPEPIPQYPANVAHAMGAKGWTTPIWVETVE